MDKYMFMTKSDRIKYAKQNVLLEVIINYQNAIGRSMIPKPGHVTRAFRGVAGKDKKPVGVVAQIIPDSDKVRLSIIRDNGIHSSTYTMKMLKYQEMMGNFDEF